MKRWETLSLEGHRWNRPMVKPLRPRYWWLWEIVFGMTAGLVFLVVLGLILMGIWATHIWLQNLRP